MKAVHVATVAAIPAVMLVFAETIQAVAQTSDAMQLHPDDAATRIRKMEYLTGGVVVAATIAGSAILKDSTPLVAALAVLLVMYGFDYVILK